MSFISSFTYSNTMNRSELQDQLINSMIDGMDFKTMWSVLYDYMVKEGRMTKATHKRFTHIW